MRIPAVPHRWKISPQRAVAIQRTMAQQVVRRGSVGSLRLVAGADLSFSRDNTQCIAGVVVWDVKQQEIVEQHVVHRPIQFPYISGMLSFREAPALIAALRRVRTEPDAFIFDGHGYAHPRRFGLACHIGVMLDRPCIGCAKSRLIGTFEEPGELPGTYSLLEVQDGELVGAVVRTKRSVKPVFVSVGHRITLSHAISVVLKCVTRYRLPEPTRLADQLVSLVRAR